MGESMEKLLGWLADYGAKNRGVSANLPGRGGGRGESASDEALDAALVYGSQPDMYGGCVVLRAGHPGGGKEEARRAWGFDGH